MEGFFFFETGNSLCAIPEFHRKLIRHRSKEECREYLWCVSAITIDVMKSQHSTQRFTEKQDVSQEIPESGVCLCSHPKVIHLTNVISFKVAISVCRTIFCFLKP